MSAPLIIPSNTSLLLVNTSSFSKTFILPTISTNPGRLLIFKDIHGSFSTSSVFLSTTGIDGFENNSSTMRLNTNYGAWTFMNDAMTRWYLIDSYKNTMLVSSIASAASAAPSVSVRLINLGSASGGPTSGSFTVNSSAGGGTGTFTNSDVFQSSGTWGMAQCFDGARSDYDLYMTQNPNFMQIVFPRALTVTKIFLVPRNQGDAFPSSLVLKADGTSVGTYSSSTVSQSLGMGISYSGTGFYIQPSVSGTTWRFDFSSTPVSFGEIEFWGYS